MKRSHTILSSAALVSLGALSGCDGSGTRASGDGDAGPPLNGDDSIDPIALGTGGSSPGVRGVREGGSVDLTAEEIEAIENAACTGWAAEGETMPAVLQLVVDASSSMGHTAPGSDRSKWEVTRDALSDAIAALPPTISLGVLYYPNTEVVETEEPKPVSACVNGDAMIPIALLGGPDGAHRTLVETSLQEAELHSWTPTYDAYTYALENGLLPYPGIDRFMLLITDGAPTVGQDCVRRDPPTQPIVDKIAGAYAVSNVRTFVIGAPGSEVDHEGNDMRPWLSEAASLAGTASDGCGNGPNYCHMDMTSEPDFSQALRSGLASIVGQIVNSCEFALPAAPEGREVEPNSTNVFATWGDGSSTLFLPDSDGICSDGWFFNAEGNVELCPTTCDRLKLDHQATIQLHFGCGDTVIPVR